MGWTFVVRATELESFRRCLRQWDLGAGIREAYAPILPPRVADLDRAIHDALAVYYFPAMDDWSREIVRPLALRAFHRRMNEGRTRREATCPLDEGENRAWEGEVRLGERVLHHLFAWVAGIDQFESIFSDHEFWVGVPDPNRPGRELVTPDGWPVRYLGRIDQLLCADDDEYWVVDHRLVRGAWLEGGALLDDRFGRSFVWAMRHGYPQLRIVGNVYNEIRIDSFEADEDPHARDAPVPPGVDRDMSRSPRANRRRDYLSATDVDEGSDDEDRIVRFEGADRFRRTWVRRSPRSLAEAAAELAADVERMVLPELGIGPHHTPENCGECLFRDPCDAMDESRDPEAILAERYRRRPGEEADAEERMRRAAGSAAGGGLRPRGAPPRWD